ncbi:hypothetical protein TWF694_005903 [Orbilia ellipsospora]|uniref:NAD(P)-binding protein n=1 Tax=Orbilia ellipsospora TaxID=2528407 RepID=A0AAV9WTM4_9PEZI
MAITLRYDPKNLPDLTGKVAIVTGANVGIGLETAYNLASRNATVYLFGRSEERTLAAIDKIQKRLKEIKVDTKLYYHHLDLNDLKGCKKSAEDFMTKEDSLDIVVCNAGAMGTKWTAEWEYEPMFHANHLGHFIFVNTLLPLLERTAAKTNDVRIAVVSSYAYHLVKGIDYDGITKRPANSDGPRGMSSFMLYFKRYAVSKLANIWYAKELNRRYGDKGIYANAVHPGYVGATDLGVEIHDIGFAFMQPIFKAISAWTGMSWADGAKNQTFAAISPQVKEQNLRGRYLEPKTSLFNYFKAPKDVKLGPPYTTEENWAKLWEWSEEAMQKAIA